jgi:DNA-directed RNA polymerase subunit H (RpoH/RPB5)
VSSIEAFEHLETHELIEAEDLNPILEQAKVITQELPRT